MQALESWQPRSAAADDERLLLDSGDSVTQPAPRAEAPSRALDGLLKDILPAFGRNSLPVIFKEKVAAYLARYCAVSFPLIYHSCGLYALGVKPRDILLLLHTPTSAPDLLDTHLDALAVRTAPLPENSGINRDLDDGLLACLGGLYLEERAEDCRKHLFRLLGPLAYESICDLVTTARAFHRWAETHQDALPEAEVLIRAQFVALLDEDVRLAETFHHYRATGAPRVQVSAADMLTSAMGFARYPTTPPARPHGDEGYTAFQNDEALRAIIYASPLAIATMDMSGIIRSWNPAAERMFGWAEHEVLERFNPIVPGDSMDEFRALCRRVCAGEAIVAEQVRRERRDGALLDVAISVAPLYDDSGTVWGIITILDDITERKRLADGIQFLDQVSRVLTSSLDYQATLARAARLVVPALADWCFVYLLEPDGSIRRLAAEHADPAMRDLMRALPNRTTRNTQSIRPMQLALQTGRTQVLSDITDQMLPDALSDSRVQQMTRALGMRSSISVPLQARGRILGVISLITADSRRRYSEMDVPLAEELARRMAVAIDNARLYSELADREQQLEGLVARLMLTQEEERRRFAYDVHDGIAQVAASAYQHLQTFARYYNPNSVEGRDALTRALALAQRTVREARELVSHLRPTALDEFGLGAAIRVQAEDLSAQGWRVAYTNGLGAERLPAPVETALYRITQEALTNIQKHAAATDVEVTLERLPASVRLVVQDWGTGFDVERVPSATAGGQHVGLGGIRERAHLLGGTCTIDSKPGEGARIVVEIPLASPTRTPYSTNPRA